MYDLIDVHSHVNFNAFRDDGHDVIERSLKNGIGVINVGSQIDTSRRAVEYAERYPEGVWAMVGLHPIHLGDYYFDAEELCENKFHTKSETFSFDAYKKLAENPKVVALGECGLDYFRAGMGEEEKNLQKDVFREHVRLARDVKKPLMIHCRDAYDDLYKILKDEKAEEIGGDMHFFAGSIREADKFLSLGFYLSFTGVITFPKAQSYHEVIRHTPMERIMVETDAPYVAPVPYRGKRNEPLYVAEVAKKVAEIKGISFEEVCKITTQNARRLFGL